MKSLVDDPFRGFDAIVAEHPADVVIVDFHAETTSEKNAFGWHADGRAHVVYGTHTHIPTADARILPNGTAFVTDIGMTGARDTIIGVSAATALPSYLTGVPTRFTWPETGIAWVNAVVADVDTAAGQTTTIERVQREVAIA